MTAMKYLLPTLLVLAEGICLASGWVPIILRGRPKGGMLGPPREKRPGEVLPQPMIFNLQRRDHFSGSRVYYWNQRYFVNDAFFKPGGPIFLLIGGEASADPLWLLDGAMVEYAKTFNAFCVLLEHRFYGKSQPTNDLSLESLTFLSSKQALADIAAFIDDELRIKFNLTNNKLITFGGGYSGSLSAWFRNKYPQMVDGAVASSAPIYMDLDVGSYLATIVDVMANTSHPACVKETFTATNTIFDWWGQPDKLEKMFQMFRLCDRIDHDNLIEPSALYSALADNWQLVAQYNGVNRTFTGTTLNTTETTINTLCGIMTDGTRGPSIQRYADVSNLILEKLGKKCLEFKYQKLISEMKQESLESSVAEGARQWIYQSCTEFGWFAGSDRGQVPFGPYFALPFK
ncbi:hypothetical protein CHS0354_034971 [Potamilus streckersoni]|uniref:Serine carboxypeptidase S28 n=1 Tax=Potamilus streckersoni TaxID=2493646 RepID=A0AAE0VTW2_9BIVA|nr:hypothetical protein CHS0354_034971 [Potamilus streckersoni]